MLCTVAPSFWAVTWPPGLQNYLLLMMIIPPRHEIALPRLTLGSQLLDKSAYQSTANTLPYANTQFAVVKRLSLEAGVRAHPHLETTLPTKAAVDGYPWS